MKEIRDYLKQIYIIFEFVEWGGGWGSNPRPTEPQSVALTS